MATNPRIKIDIPRSLKITASETSKLKKAFKTDVVSVLKKHRRIGSDITNVDPVVDVIAVASGSARQAASKASAGKKATKKK